MAELDDLADLIQLCGYGCDIDAQDMDGDAFDGDTYLRVGLLQGERQVGGFCLVVNDDDPTLCRFSSLWLAEGHRDQGFLSLFGSHMETWFREAGFKYLRIEGTNENIRSRLLHMGVSEGPGGTMFVEVGNPNNPVAQYRDRRYRQGEHMNLEPFADSAEWCAKNAGAEEEPDDALKWAQAAKTLVEAAYMVDEIAIKGNGVPRES